MIATPESVCGVQLKDQYVFELEVKSMLTFEPPWSQLFGRMNWKTASGWLRYFMQAQPERLFRIRFKIYAEIHGS